MRRDDTPRVSFLLAVHNTARFLPATLRSILDQTFEDYELVAVDDASTDGTADILRSAGDRRLRYFRNETNVGQVPSLNVGLGYCRGEFVARIDGDDVCEPDRLAAQVRHLDEHRDLVGCATWTTEIDEHDAVTGSVEPCGDPDYVRWLLCHTNRLYHPTMTLRRRALELAGGYDEQYPATEDYELWTRLVAGGARLGVVQRRLVRYRRRAGSITDTNRELQRVVGRRISTRFVSQLVGRACDEQTVGLMKTLLSWERPDPAALSPGRVSEALALMAELRRRTLGRAAAAARADADEEVARHLIRQARFLLSDAPSLAARLALHVARLPGHRLSALQVVAVAARCMAGRRRRRAPRRDPDAPPPGHAGGVPRGSGATVPPREDRDGVQ